MSKTADFVNLCISASEGTTNRIRLKIDRFLAAQIPLPPLDEQCRVVARIEELAAKVAETRGLRKEAEKEIGFISRSASLQIFEAIKDNQNVMVENICAEIIDNLHSNPIYSDIGVPCVRSPDVGWGKLYLEKALKTSEEDYIHRTVRGEPIEDDIVLVREGGGTGKAAIVEKINGLVLVNGL